jgi:hypothetical protein
MPPVTTDAVHLVCACVANGTTSPPPGVRAPSLTGSRRRSSGKKIGHITGEESGTLHENIFPKK